jgi:hypothetical protein
MARGFGQLRTLSLLRIRWLLVKLALSYDLLKLLQELRLIVKG